MFYRGNTRIHNAGWIVFLLCALLLLPWLGETLFNSKGEPREALVAVSMLQTGDWILPLNFGSDIPYKPPFMAWLIAGLAWLFNGGVVNEYLSRLPSALAAIALIMGGFAWVRNIRGDRFAIIFSIVTLTCFEVFRASMACRLDMVLTACMVLPVYLVYDIAENGRSRAVWHKWLAAWALLTCAVLTKGPVGALLPCLVCGVYLLLRRRRFFPTLLQMLGLALGAMAVAAIWYYAAWLRGGQEFLNLALEENIGRLTGTMSYESHEQPFWYNFVTLIAGCLPWTLLAIFAAFSRNRRFGALKPAGILALTAVIIIVGFYTIPASKRSVYLLPAYPFVCYAIASIVDSVDARKAVRAFTWLIAVLAIAAPVVFIVILAVRPEGIEITAPHWYAWVAMLPAPALGIAWIVNRHSPVGHLTLTVWALYLAYISCIMPAVLNPRSDKHLIPTIPADENTEILILKPDTGGLFRLYTLDFYYGDRIRLVESAAEAAGYPAGTVVLVAENNTDTTALRRDFDYRQLTRRNCDTRRPLGIAIRRRL